MKDRKLKFNYFRLALQWAVLVLLGYMVSRLWFDSSYKPDFEAYCPLGGMLALSSFFANDTLACSMSSVQIAMGIALLVAIIIFSKLFCGYLCPVGTITEWLGKLGRKFKIQTDWLTNRFNGYLDKSLRVLKYVLLFITVYFTVSSSELFCKKFDPYYASFTGFSGGDIVIWFAIITVSLTIIGSIFIRQFWCKYLCPLAAISNIFTYFPVFIIVFGIYLLLFLININLSWIYPTTLTILAVCVLEFIRLKDGIIIPLFRISRNDDTCTGCKLCDKACPQAIVVSTGSEKIEHIDCNLCCDCVIVCPQKGTLNISSRLQIPNSQILNSLTWFPATVTVLLIICGLFFGAYVEFPTVNEKWGTEEQFARMKIFQKEGLKEIKCYGSSMAFLSQMHQVNGVIGAATFVGSHTVKIYYDSMLVNETALNQALFVPLKYLINFPDTSKTNIGVYSFNINRFFDKYDSFYLTKLLEQQNGIYGFETKYGEPVSATVYFNPNIINLDAIRKIIESKEFNYEIAGIKNTVSINFEITEGNKMVEILIADSLINRFFKPYYATFKQASEYDTTSIRIYEIPMLQLAYPQMNHWLPYLESHLSNDTAIVAFKTELVAHLPVVKIYYIEYLADSFIIYNELTQDSFKINYDNGDVENIKNPYDFSK